MRFIPHLFSFVSLVLHAGRTGSDGRFFRNASFAFLLFVV